MDSKSLVFLGLISGPRQYRIPAFQRAYSWEKEDRETLWLDMLTQYEVLDSVWDRDEAEREEELNKRSTHYLGTIVLSGPSSLGVPKSDIIDGQQRITTLLLAVCALRDHWGNHIAKEQGVSEAEAKRRTISNTFLVNDGQQGNERYRVLPLSTDEKVFRAIVNFSGSGKLTADMLGLEPGDSDRMLRAYQFFRTEMARKKVPEANIQLKRFAHLYPLDPERLEQALAHRLSVIAIETKNNDDTNAIFESLNGKGRPLTQLDLLRNYVFMTLGRRADNVLKEEWLPIEHTHLPDRKDMEAFVWADVVSRGTNVLQKRTYRTVQSEIREAGSSPAAAEQYVKRLKRRAPSFAQIIDPSRATDVSLGNGLTRLARVGGKTARPLALWLFEEKSQGRCESSDVVACLKHVESFLARRFLCALAPNNLNSMFGIMLSRLNNPASAVGESAGTVEHRLLTALMSVPRDFPDDSALVEGILAHDFYHNGDTRQRTHIMRSLDLSFNYDLVPGYEESDRSIEHILPQAKNPTPWIADLKALNEEFVSTQDRWLHTLGNLTVVAPGDNSALGAKRFPEKAVIFDRLGYKMTKAVPTFAVERGGELLWGAVAIEARGRDLANRASAVWPRPAIAPLSLESPASDDPGGEFDDDVDEPVPFTSSIDEESDDATATA